MKVKKKEIDSGFSTRLNQLLKIRKMTQSELSRATGLSKMHISSYTLGRNIPKLDNGVKIANALGTTCEFLSTGHENQWAVSLALKADTLENNNKAKLDEYVNALLTLERVGV